MIEKNSSGNWEVGVGLGGGSYPSDNFIIQNVDDNAVRFSIDGDGNIKLPQLTASRPLWFDSSQQLSTPTAANFMSSLGVEQLLSTTTVSLAADGDTTIFTVPTGKTCVLTKAILVAGAAAGETLISIGQNGAETDFISARNLRHLTVSGNFVELDPFRCIYLRQLGIPVKSKQYAAGTVIQAQVSSFAGGASNTLYLFGILL